MSRASVLANHANVKAEERGAPGWLSRYDVLPFLSQPCHYCGRDGGPMPRERIGIDHVIPMSKGGTNTIDNLVPACASCNSSKRSRKYPARGAYYLRSEGVIAPEDYEKVRYAQVKAARQP